MIQKQSEKIIVILCCLVILSNSLPIFSQQNRPFIFDARSRYHAKEKQEESAVRAEKLKWLPNETAIIICDMWNQHWCEGATKRVTELAPRIEDFVSKARKKGVLIVHAPSGVIDYYKNHPARKNGQKAPQAANIPKDMGKWRQKIETEDPSKWPIDQSDGGCDCDPTCQHGSPWKKQIEIIKIENDDVISDSGIEIWNLFEERGIKNVFLVGVHTNMCVIGRPFGLRNMKRVGKNVVLCRDLTDTMYNSRMKPFVNHFAGTELIVRYIEEYVCPTITSTVFTEKPPFRFKNDLRTKKNK